MKNNMMKQLLSVITLTFCGLGLQAYANDTYWGVDIALYEIDDGFSVDVTQLQGVYGWETSYQGLGAIPLDAEVRASFGLDGDDGIDLSYTLGVYARQRFSMDAPMTPYIIAGITHAKADAGRFGSDTDTGVSFGAGALYELSHGYTLRAEYMLRLVDNVSGFSLGVQF